MNQNDDKAWRITEIIGGTVVALLGLFALLFPDFLSGLVSILIGAGVLVIGITQIVTSVKDRACLAFPAVRLALGLFSPPWDWCSSVAAARRFRCSAYSLPSGRWFQAP